MGNVLVVGDLHGNTNHAVSLLTVAVHNHCDRMFALGDFGAWEHMAEGRHYFDAVDKVARRRKVRVYFLDGNHDKSSLLHELYDEHLDDEGFLMCRKNIRYAPRGHRWSWDGTSFVAFGGAYSVDKGWRLQAEAAHAAKVDVRRARYGSSKTRMVAESLWFPEEEMTDEELDAMLAADSSAVDIVLAHDKPRAATPEWNRKDLPECLPNQDRIQRVVETLQPKLLLHGHLHYRYSDTIQCGDDRWTRVEGLDADPDASSRFDYDPHDSWYLLTLPLSTE